MYRLKIKDNEKVYIKKFETIQEVFSEIHNVLFGYSAVKMSLSEIQEMAKTYDIRFYLSFKA